MKSSQISGKDITGLVVGKLTVLYQTDRKCGNTHYWSCRCSCGNVKEIRKGSLVRGVTKSCGCSTRNVDITGLTSGRLTVLYQTDRKSKNGHYYWHCQCECGKTVDVIKGDLTNGATKSCRCLMATHGYSAHPLYSVFTGIKERCLNLNCKEYPNYGGRGITVCDEWLNNPIAFIEWGEANGYKKGLQIDRIDNDGNYESNNCRFVTRKENMSNRRNTQYVLFIGKKTPSVDVATKLGIWRSTVTSWIKRKRVSKKFQHLVTLIQDDNLN